jgi:HEAT repeat protein
MKPGIPEIIKLLDNGDWEVRRSSANAFSELAAHCEQKLASLYTFPNYLQRSSAKL